MTATLFKTTVKCAGGLFRFPYKHVRGLIPPQHENGYDYDQYDKLSNMLKNDYNDSILQAVADGNQSFWPALNPVAFASHLGTGLSAATAADIAPLPTNITMLRRVKGDKLNICGEQHMLNFVPIRLGRRSTTATTTRRSSITNQHSRLSSTTTTTLVDQARLGVSS